MDSSFGGIPPHMNNMLSKLGDSFNRTVKIEILLTPEEAIEVVQLIKKLRSEEKS